ncbi:hypothetical protein BCR35DRAFT_200581 [Leucosporidium creatinivorum]|uniref:Uncharacterized protein n=1 Tax=Leucosporidium creatinivorum TaxID=106004 RepID=A0A1Y2DJK4_9BASI|nr:hypothetical protein BCR35DRAFT_200581 [Leucosporidium creatinivorum]
MKFALASALLAVLPALCSATYFTNPTAGTVWSSPQGETITWKFQAGGAAVGTIVLESEATNPKSNTQTVLADSIDLTLEELAWPVGLSLPAVSTTSFVSLVIFWPLETTC